MTGSDLRVGIVVPRFAPFRGGLETYVARAAAALAAEGVRLTVITQAPRAASLPRYEVRDGYTVERHDLPVGDIFEVPSPSAARAASRATAFDVVWVHSYHTPLAWLAAEQASAPVVFTPHYHGVGHTPLRQLLHRCYRPIGRRLMAVSRRVLVDTDAEARLVLRHFPRQVHPAKVAVIPPVAADPTGGRLCQTGESNVVLTVARQEPYKRTDLLVRAITALRERGVPARLVVIGDGTALAASRELVARLRADHFVTFTGATDEEALARWWSSASLYATASEQEAYGIGLAEALLAGLPVVASDIPAHREVARHAGAAAAVLLCGIDTSAGDVVSRYADAIAKLLNVTDGRKERAAQCALPSATTIAGKLVETLYAASTIASRI